MRSRWIAGALALVALGVAGAIAACTVVTGSTDGYALAVDAAVAEIDGACLADGGLCIVLACSAAADCRGSDAGTPICCTGLLSSNSIGASCEIDSCPFGTVQACATSAECAGSECIYQGCAAGSDEFKITACGLAPGCSAIVPVDAGPPDAAKADAGAADAGTDGSPSDASDLDAPG
jgi:hypothetical protein